MSIRVALSAVVALIVVSAPSVSASTVGCRTVPTYVSFRANNGQFVAAEGGGARWLVANRGAVGNWEKFKLTTPDGSPVAYGRPVRLQGWGGQFVVSEPGQIIMNNRNAASTFETFILERALTRYGDYDCNSDNVHLKTHEGFYVTALGGGGGNLVANSTVPGPFETFFMQGQPGGLDLVRRAITHGSTPAPHLQGNWRRVTFGDTCGVSIREIGTQQLLIIDCSGSWRGVEIDAEFFKAVELKNGYHIVNWRLDHGTAEPADLSIIVRPAPNPIGDRNPYTRFRARCPAWANIAFSLETDVEGPRVDPVF